MRRTFFLPAILAAFATLPATGAGDDDLVASRRIAFDLAGAWANDGFKHRDGYWSGPLRPGKAQVVQVNLYAGNQYWFTLGTAGGAEQVSLAIFDETGSPVRCQDYRDGVRAAAGFIPKSSGTYLVKIEETKGLPTTFCLIYSYK